MTGSFISGTLLFPLLLLALSAGTGLLVRRLSGGAVSGALLVPVGFAAVVAVAVIATASSSWAPASGYIVLGVALLGVVVEAPWRGLELPRPARAIPWGVLVGLAAFAAVAGPQLFSGAPAIPGLARNVDTAFQLDFAQYLANAARHSVGADSSYHLVVAKFIVDGYPGGGQATLGAVAALMHTDVAWCFQPFMGFTAAMGAVSIFVLAGRLSTSQPLRAAGSCVAILPNVLYGYSLTGGIKELTTASLLMTVVAALGEGLPGEAGPRAMLGPAVAVAATLASFSFGVAPWLSLVFAGAFVVTVLRRGRRLAGVRDWVVMAVLAGVLAIPTLITSAKLFSIAGHAVGGVVNLGLGNLSAPVSTWSSAGVWLVPDYRYPPAHPSISKAFGVVVIVLAVIGVLHALGRRRWAVAFLGLSAPVALWYWVAHTGPWIEFKAYTVTATIALAMALVGVLGLWSLRDRPRRAGRRFDPVIRGALPVLGVGAGLAVAGAVLYEDAQTYHQTTLTPAAAFHDLADIGARYAGQGPALYPDFNEFAEYFLRREQGSSPVDPANLRFDLQPGIASAGQGNQQFDLNQFKLPFLESFRLLVVPTSPIRARPPANYQLVRTSRYFQVWRRTGSPADVIAHLPLGGSPTDRGDGYCHRVERIVRRAGPGARIAYAVPTVASGLNPVLAAHSRHWQALNSGQLRARGPGFVEAAPQVSRGTYGVWLQGSVGRAVSIAVNGRRVGTVGYQESYPGEWVYFGRVPLPGGPAIVRLTRGGGSLHPGNGDSSKDPVSGLIGPIFLQREDGGTIHMFVAPASQAARVCRAPVGYQWIDVLRPGAAGIASASTPAA